MSTRLRVLPIALSSVLGAVGSSCATLRSDHDEKVPSTTYATRRLPDGRQWMLENLNVATDQSYCYGDTAPNCRRFGRLYTWEAAQRTCQSLGNGWRLPT
ncbi:MAG: FISUMP domain-containing protein, partial [Gemmatimonadaceae bacterium]